MYLSGVRSCFCFDEMIIAEGMPQKEHRGGISETGLRLCFLSQSEPSINNVKNVTSIEWYYLFKIENKVDKIILLL